MVEVTNKTVVQKSIVIELDKKEANCLLEILKLVNCGASDKLNWIKDILTCNLIRVTEDNA